MAQNISYGMGQYTYDQNFEYITWLGTTATPGQEEDYTPLAINYIDYQPTSNNRYKDIIIELPENIQSKQTYYMEIKIPRHSKFDTTVNLKLCPNDNEDTNKPDFNNFQQIQQIIIPKHLMNNSSLYNVVLFGYDNPEIVKADIPKTFSGSNMTIEKNQLYLKDDIYKYSISAVSNAEWNNTNLKSITNKTEYNLLADWEVNNESESTGVETFTFIFTPKYSFIDSYKYLWLQIVQDNDYIRYQDDGLDYKGIKLTRDNIEATFYKVNDLISYTDFGLASIKSGINTLNSVSVYAPVNFMLTINGEEIKIGENNQYELNDYDIHSLGLIVKNSDDSGFTINYTYKIES